MGARRLGDLSRTLACDFAEEPKGRQNAECLGRVSARKTYSSNEVLIAVIVVARTTNWQNTSLPRERNVLDFDFQTIWLSSKER